MSEGQRYRCQYQSDTYRCHWQRYREVQVSVAERGTSVRGREWYRCWGFKVLMDIYIMLLHKISSELGSFTFNETTVSPLFFFAFVKPSFNSFIFKLHIWHQEGSKLRLKCWDFMSIVPKEQLGLSWKLFTCWSFTLPFFTSCRPANSTDNSAQGCSTCCAPVATALMGSRQQLAYYGTCAGPWPAYLHLLP